MAEFVEIARGYREAPSEKFFILPKEHPCSRDDLCEMLAMRGTALYAVTFTTPPFIEEIVVPQLKKSTQAICESAFAERFCSSSCPLPDGKGAESAAF